MNMYHQMIAVTNRHLCCSTNQPGCAPAYLKQLNRIASLGVRAIVLREKDLTPDQYEHLAKEVRSICETHHTKLILHGFPAVAKKLGHKKIHLPLSLFREMQEDGNRHTDTAALLPGDFDEIGASVHSLAEALEAQTLGAHYIFAGNIYKTACKQGLAGRGLSFLRELCVRCDIPVYAIGGITPQQMPEILNAGAAGGCMMSGFMQLTE